MLNFSSDINIVQEIFYFQVCDTPHDVTVVSSLAENSFFWQNVREERDGGWHLRRITEEILDSIIVFIVSICHHAVYKLTLEFNPISIDNLPVTDKFLGGKVAFDSLHCF